MKKKYVAVLLGMALCGTSMNTYSVDIKAESEENQEAEIEATEIEETEGTDAAEEEAQEKIYGEVVSVSEESVTVKTGTMAKREPGENGEEEPEEPQEQPEESQEKTKEFQEQPPEEPEQPSMLELTGEEQTISFTEETVFSKKSMGGPGGDAPQKPDKEAEDTEETDPEETEETITWEDISEGDTVKITLAEDGTAAEITLITMGMGQPGGGQSQEPEEYAAVTEYTEDTQTEGESYLSSGTDENAVHVLEDVKVVMKDAQIERISEESTGGDTSSFYGVGAALLASGGEAYVSNSTVTTDAAGGAGLFAYGEGVVYAADTDITTEQDTSGGIHAAGGGTLYAWDLNVETKGESSAAIRSDRGGGTMVINGGSYTSKGTGSPAVYCTADISVNNAELTAEGSEAVCIEGLNSLHLYDSDLSGNMSDDSRNDCTWNVILYQSMSGDSEVGNSTFEMNGGTLTGKNGGMFYTTNTESTITLSDVDITYPEECDYFLKCTGNDNERGWGTSGANGADCLFTAVSQDMTGDILWDSISRLDLYLTQGSTLEGAMVMDETCAGTGGEGTAKIFISEDSQWTVTGDSTAGELYCAGTITDTEGKTVTIKGTDGTVYEEGDGEYTITVDYYEDTTDLSGASQTTQWSSAEAEKPTEL